MRGDFSLPPDDDAPRRHRRPVRDPRPVTITATDLASAPAAPPALEAPPFGWLASLKANRHWDR
jgi:hypothetical protein